MFCVDEGRDTPRPLDLGDGVQGQGGLSTGFRAVDLDHAAPGIATDTQGDIQARSSARKAGNAIGHDAIGHCLDRALSKLLFNARNREFNCLALGEILIGRLGIALALCHALSP